MSIPLDRLYDFLKNISKHNLIIYGWQPHGSKKLQDLTRWNPKSKYWRDRKTSLTLIFHDQEPLDYELSQLSVENEFYEIAKDWPDFFFVSTPIMQKIYKQMHLRSLSEINFYDLTLLVHSEKNSDQVVKYEQNNFVPVYYWSHAVIARDWFRFAEIDPCLRIKSPTPKTFLIYNRAWTGTREYRLKFAEQLINTNLYQNCVTSFAELDNDIHYTQYPVNNTQFKVTRSDLEKILPKNTYNSAASADYDSYDYQNSLIEVVLETLFDDQRNHLTEKTLRPIAVGQPFILASTPGSLQYLRNYGFKTFDQCIDETYDTIKDSTDRLHAIITEMQRIDNLSSRKKQKLVNRLQSTVDHNRELFFSKQFHEHLINEFRKNLDDAVEKVKTGPVGNTWKQFRSIAQEQYPEMFFNHMQQNVSDTNWANEWLYIHSKT
jgi:hypothetical protein